MHVQVTREFLPWSRQFHVLFRRSLHEISRRRFMIYVQTAQACCMGEGLLLPAFFSLL